MARQVKVELVIDDKGSVKAITKAGTEAEKAEGHLTHLDRGVKELGKSFGGLKNMIGLGLGALGVAGVGSTLVGAISKTKEIAEETHKFRNITGMGAQSALDYTAALNATGVGAEAGSNAFKFLSRNLQTAERQWHTYNASQQTAAEKGKVATTMLGVQATAFKQLGVNVGQFMALSEQGKFEAITKAFEKMAPGVQKTRLEVQLFGRGGTALAPVLESGALSLNKYDQMAKKFFPTLKDGAHTEEELLARQAEAKMAWEGLQFTLGTKLAPALSAVFGWFSKVTVEMEHGHGTWAKVKTDIEAVVGVVKGLWSGLESIIGPAKAIELALAGILAFKFGAPLTKLMGFFSGGAGAVSLGPYVALAGAAYFAAHELHLFGENLANTSKADREVAEGKKPAASTIEGIRGHYYLEHPGAAAGGVSGLSGFNRKWLAEQLKQEAEHPAQYSNLQGAALTQFAQQAALAAQNAQPGMKVDVNMDGLKVAEAIVRNPRANRHVAEGTAHYTTKMGARG